MAETRSAKAERQPRRWGAAAQLVFFVFWAVFVLVRCVIVMHRGYYRLGRNAHRGAVIASQQPLLFFGSLSIWAAIGLIVLVWAIRRFRGT
jgi:predicted metal-binding membrane protein